MLLSIFNVLRTESLQILFYKFLLKWEKNEEDFGSSILFEAKKYYFVFDMRSFFSNGYIRNVISTLPSIVKIDVENDNVVSTSFNDVQFNVEIDNIHLTLLNVVNFNIYVHFNVDLTLCVVATSYQPKNNAKPSLKCFLGIILCEN